MSGRPVARHEDHLSHIRPLARPCPVATRQTLLHLLGLLLVACLCFCTMTSGAYAASRSLTLYNTHTKETTTITYKRNGRFDADGLRKLNRFLRDWRRNESTTMDPALFDLIWQVYKYTGAKKPIHVVSGYRSPATNNMLRSRSRGVAKNSRHTMGQAMDFYLPGVPISKIRDAGLRLQAGGVGYYPGSRSPFVHIDTGNVRHWPRMTRKQLAKVFPRGKTVHVPRDGKPFSRYKQAKAEVAKRKAEMVRTSRSARRFTQVASAAPARSTRTRATTEVAQQTQQNGTLFGRLLNRTPQDRPKPEFEKTPPEPAPVTLAEDTVDEAEESGQLGAGAFVMPEKLAALPRVPQNRPTPIAEPNPAVDLAEQSEPASTLEETPDNSSDATAEETQVAALNAEETDQPDETAADPLLFASLPRSRPDFPSNNSFQLASAEPASPNEPAAEPANTAAPLETEQPPQTPALPEAVEVAQATTPVASDKLTMELASATAATEPLPANPEQSEQVIASLPRARNVALPADQAQNQTLEVAQSNVVPAPTDKPEGTAAEILAQLTGAEGPSAETAASNRVAYASTGPAFVAKLPSPRLTDEGLATDLAALPRNADRQQLASLSTDLPQRTAPESNLLAPKANPIVAQAPAPVAETSEQDHLARLTFAYGPSGMAHFAHMKQSTKTATFARLSRPIPNNLRALVSKPGSIIDQTFSHHPSQLVGDAHFVGPAIARMAVRSFN